MRATGEQASQNSAAGTRSPAADDKRPATPKVAGARSHPRAPSSSAASAAGGSTMGDDPEIEFLYSGESDSPSDSKSPAKPGRKLWVQKRRLLRLVAISIRLCAIECSAHPTSLMTRINLMGVRDRKTLFIVTTLMNLHRVIVAVYIPVFAAIVMPLLMLALRKRRNIVTRYDLLL